MFSCIVKNVLGCSLGKFSRVIVRGVSLVSVVLAIFANVSGSSVISAFENDRVTLSPFSANA